MKKGCGLIFLGIWLGLFWFVGGAEVRGADQPATGKVAVEELLRRLEGTATASARIPVLLELVKTLSQAEDARVLSYCQMGLDDSVQQGNKSAQASFLLEMGRYYYRLDSFPEARNYFTQSLNLRQELKEQAGIAQVYNILGSSYLRTGENAKALDYYLKSKKISEDIGDNNHLMITLGNLGIIYFRQGQYRQALEYYFKALEMREKAGDKKPIANSYNNIGAIYTSLGQPDQALSYHQKALKIVQELDNIRMIADTYNYIGNIYQSKKDFPQALNYFQKSLALKIQIGGKDGVAYAKLAIGSIYYEQGKYEMAQKVLQEAQTAYQEIKNREGLSNVWFWIGKCAFKQGNLQTALEYLEKSFAVAKELDITSVIRDSAEVLDQIYLKMNRFKEAYEYHVIFKEKNDSLNIKENIKKITRMQMQYDFDKKQKQQELEQEKKDLQKAAELKQQRFLKFAFSGLAVFIALVFFTLFRVKTRDNRRLQQEILNRQQAERELLKSMKLETIGILAAGIAHDFNNLLAIIVGNLSMAEACLEDISKEPNPHVVRAQKASDQAADLVKNFLTLSEGGWAQKKNTALSAIVQDVQAASELKQIPLTVTLSADLPPILCDERQLRQVLVNLVLNADEAIQGTGRDKKISLSASQVQLSPDNQYKLTAGDYLEITLQDNGRGIPAELLEKVFDPYFSTKERGTQKGMGLSLAVCAAVVQRHFGHIYFTSELEVGTTVHLLLPVAETIPLTTMA